MPRSVNSFWYIFYIKFIYESYSDKTESSFTNLLFTFLMKRSVGKLPLVGLIRFVDIQFLLSDSLLYHYKLGTVGNHVLCLFLCGRYKNRLLLQGYTLIEFLFIGFTANALVAFMSNGSQNLQTLRVFQVFRSSMHI